MEAVVPPVVNVTGTAFLVAAFRADENHAQYPLYGDPIVPLLLNDASREAAARLEETFPQVKDMVKLRTRYIDDMLDVHLHSKYTQVVILGAGLDTRAVRKAVPGVTYFEIDDVTTLDWKQARYREHGIEANVRFIPGNYVTDDLIALLLRHDFDIEAPTYVIWEGNTMYLSAGDDARVLRQLRENVERFSVTFDYMSEAVIAKGTGDPGVTRLVESFASLGAPWLTGFSDIQRLAQDVGLKVMDSVATRQLHEWYWGNRLVTSAIFRHYFVCTLVCPAINRTIQAAVEGTSPRS